MSRTVQEKTGVEATMKSMVEIRHTPLGLLTADRVDPVVRRIVSASRNVAVAAFGSAI